MVSNSSEEGLMQQIGNPSHTDPARIAVMGGLACGLAVFFLLAATLGTGVSATVAGGLGVTVAVALYRRISARRAGREEAAREAYRVQRERDTQRGIAAMKEAEAGRSQ